MTKVQITLTSTIVQEEDQESFDKEMPGEITEEDGVIRISYLEDGEIPVKMLLKDNELIIKRGVDKQNYSFMRFVPGEKEKCRYLVQGRQMDLISVTNLLDFSTEIDGKRKLHVEYDLFSGLYLIGNYTVTLIFT
ncbi:DUF1934 domain-containing protein [Lactobacillus sp. PSON]|uniref:DUF1934 domain-containing protein n=1 Tax=Lactobacillus sp. PSON TaxID=3455454 RepID=UPI00404322C2